MADESVKIILTVTKRDLEMYPQYYRGHEVLPPIGGTTANTGPVIQIHDWVAGQMSGAENRGDGMGKRAYRHVLYFIKEILGEKP